MFFFRLNMNLKLILNSSFFQLVNKTTHKTNAKSVPAYVDDYETGGGSTVYEK